MTIKVINNNSNDSVKLLGLPVGKTFTWQNSLFIVTHVLLHNELEIDALNLSANGTKFKFEGIEDVIPVDIEIKIV